MSSNNNSNNWPITPIKTVHTNKEPNRRLNAVTIETVFR